MENKNFTFDFTGEETNVVLNALGALPYIQSAPVIEKMRVQAAQQLNPQVNEEAQGPQVLTEG